jgi:hypothetical protein
MNYANYATGSTQSVSSLIPFDSPEGAEIMESGVASLTRKRSRSPESTLASHSVPLVMKKMRTGPSLPWKPLVDYTSGDDSDSADAEGMDIDGVGLCAFAYQCV